MVARRWNTNHNDYGSASALSTRHSRPARPLVLRLACPHLEDYTNAPASWYNLATRRHRRRLAGQIGDTDSAWCHLRRRPPPPTEPAKHLACEDRLPRRHFAPTSRPPQPKASTPAKNSEPRSTRYGRRLAHSRGELLPTSPASPRPSPYDQSRPATDADHHRGLGMARSTDPQRQPLAPAHGHARWDPRRHLPVTEAPRTSRPAAETPLRDADHAPTVAHGHRTKGATDDPDPSFPDTDTAVRESPRAPHPTASLGAGTPSD